MVSYELIFFLLFNAAVFGIAFYADKRSLHKCRALRLEGVRINRLLKQLLVDLQQHRGMMTVLLGGDASFKSRIEQKQATISQDFATLDASDTKGLMTKERWESVRNDWQALRTEARSLSVEASFKRHSELIRAMLYLIGDVAERSQLVGTCAADFNLVDALWGKLPSVAEGLGKARGLGAGAAAKGYCSGVTRTKLRFLEEFVAKTIVYVDKELDHADLSHAPSFNQAWKDAHTAVHDFLHLLDERMLGVEQPTIDAEHYFSAATKAIEAVFHAFDQASSTLEESL